MTNMVLFPKIEFFMKNNPLPAQMCMLRIALKEIGHRRIAVPKYNDFDLGWNHLNF